MTETSKLGSTDTSRRCVLRAAAALGAATPFLILGVEPAAAKVSQASVAYQNTPKGSQSCANCKLFVTPSTCKTVDGTVAASGWCKIWVKI